MQYIALLDVHHVKVFWRGLHLQRVTYLNSRRSNFSIHPQWVTALKVGSLLNKYIVRGLSVLVHNIWGTMAQRDRDLVQVRCLFYYC